MAKFTIEVEPVADDSELRRQLSEALAAVEKWKATVGRWADIRDEALTERDTARKESERLRGELAKAAEKAQHQRNRADTLGSLYEGEVAAKYSALDARDRAIAERDEARDSLAMSRATVDEVAAERDRALKALSDEKARGPSIGVAGCDLKAGSHVVWMDSAELATLRRERDAAQSQWRALQSEIEGRDADRAELAALRARIAELEAELAKAEKQRDENHASAREWRSFFDTVIKERDAARIEVITSKNKLTDARAALDRLI